MGEGASHLLVVRVGEVEKQAVLQQAGGGSLVQAGCVLGIHLTRVQVSLLR